MQEARDVGKCCLAACLPHGRTQAGSVSACAVRAGEKDLDADPDADPVMRNLIRVEC